jgi:biopolymer transport protein ExbD
VIAMLRLARPRPRRQTESTIALINVVFLMLIFFLVAGSLTPPLDGGVTLIETRLSEATAPPDALFATADGRLRARGQEVTVESFVAAMGEGAAIRFAADRELPGTRLVEIVGELRAAGAGTVLIITERAAP